MPFSPADRQDKFHAAFLGVAIGDALGFPLRGAPPASLARLPSLAEGFAPRPRGRFARGQFSDDTQLLLAVAESVIRDGKVDGRGAAAHLAWLWEEGVILQPPRSLAEALERLSGGAPWMSAGAPLGVCSPSVLTRALVPGLFHSGEPGRLPHDAAVLSVLTHKDSACAAAAAAYAQAVALGFVEGALTAPDFCEQLAGAAGVHHPAVAEELRHLPLLLSWETGRALARLRQVGVPPAELAGVEGLPPHVVPVLLTALYAALRAPHDFQQALTLVLGCGGEVDVAAAVCGGLLGAHLGTSALPPRLRRHVLYAESLVDTAERLWQAHQARQTLQAAVSVAGRRR